MEPLHGDSGERTGEAITCLKGDFTLMEWPPLALDPVIEDLLVRNVPIAFGLSGGVDGATACAYTLQALKERGYTGPCIGIHSHLGRIEHTDSLPACQRLCNQLGLELVVVQRLAGDMMDRWLQRWNDNVARYTALLCVKLILPWSTAAMRFCTAELKTALIGRELVQRYHMQTILSVIGIRWDESPKRAKTPIWSPQVKLESKTFATTGYNWHPILPWTKEQCFAYHQARGLHVHEAYSKWGMSRVSCVFCILARFADLVSATKNPDYHEIYRELVWLEIISTYSFQPDQWLGDIAPALLPEDMRDGLARAKGKAKMREAAERRIPGELLYTRNWPTSVPTWDQAALLSEVRQSVAEIMGLSISYTDPEAVRGRYAELFEEKTRRDEELVRVEKRRAARTVAVV